MNAPAAAAASAAASASTATWSGATAVSSSSASSLGRFVLNLPPGYHFLPTNAELIIHYLWPRLANQQLPLPIFVDERILDYHPDRLIEKYMQYGDDRWFFFTKRQRKHEGGNRPNRATPDNGHWNATGSPRQIRYSGALVGCVRTLVFYEASRSKKKNNEEVEPPPPEEERKANNGVKTNWTMYEYESLTSEEEFVTADDNAKMDMIVLCTIQKKKQQKKKHSEEEAKDGETKKSTKRKMKEKGKEFVPTDFEQGSCTGSRKKRKHTTEEPEELEDDHVQRTSTETEALGLLQTNYVNVDPNTNIGHCFFANTSSPVSTPPQETMMASAARGDGHISVHPSTAAMKNYSQLFQAPPLLAQEFLHPKILARAGGGNNCSIMAPNTWTTTTDRHLASETAPPEDLSTSWWFNEYPPQHMLQNTLKMVVASPEVHCSCGFGSGLSNSNSGFASDSHRRLSTGTGHLCLLGFSSFSSHPSHGVGSRSSPQQGAFLHNKVSGNHQSFPASMVGSEEWRGWCSTQGSSGVRTNLEDPPKVFGPR